MSQQPQQRGSVAGAAYRAGVAKGRLRAGWRLITRLVAFVMSFVVIVLRPGIPALVLLGLWVLVGLLAELAHLR